jgi:hypothetical protein
VKASRGGGYLESRPQEATHKQNTIVLYEVEAGLVHTGKGRRVGVTSKALEISRTS